MSLLTSGSANCAYGLNALDAITTTQRNCAFGISSLQENTGNFNVGVGWRTLAKGTADSNTAIGDTALPNLTTGGGNCVLGCGAGFSMTTGERNCCLGCFSGETLTVEQDTVLLGHNTQSVGFNNTVVLGAGGVSSKSNQATIHNCVELVAGSDNTMDVGSSTRRVKDIYLGGDINGLGVIGNLFTQTATRAAYTTQTTFADLLSTGIGSRTLNANTLVAGSSLRMKVGGIYSCSNGNDLVFRFMGGVSGTTVLYTTDTINCTGGAAGDAYELEVDMTIRGVGSTASFAIDTGFIAFNGSDIVGASHDSDLSQIDTTIDNVFSIEVSLLNSGMSINSTLFILDKSR